MANRRSGNALERHARAEGKNNAETVRNDILILTKRINQCKTDAPHAKIQIRYYVHGGIEHLPQL
jgi:hypothetical protein